MNIIIILRIVLTCIIGWNAGWTLGDYLHKKTELYNVILASVLMIMWILYLSLTI